jgi:hypothetical protein
MNDKPPKCEHWIIGNIVVEERDGLTHTYERSILLSFKTLEDYRAALPFIDPFMADE